VGDDVPALTVGFVDVAATAVKAPASKVSCIYDDRHDPIIAINKRKIATGFLFQTACNEQTKGEDCSIESLDAVRFKPNALLVGAKPSVLDGDCIQADRLAFNQMS